MASGRYDIDIQETSLLNLAYKGFYLLQAMGQFSKDNALRDDLSVRMNTLANKLDFDNPSELNEGVMNGIKALAMDKEGNYRDEVIIKPFYEAISGYFESGIKPITERKENMEKSFMEASDKIYSLQKLAQTGFYADDNQAIKSLDDTQKKFMKNANLFSIQQRKFLGEELNDLKDVADIVTFMDKHDMDKALKGVQADMTAKGAAVPFRGQTLQDWFNTVGTHLEVGDFTGAKKLLTDMKVRDKLLAAETMARVTNIKSHEAILSGALTPIKNNALLKEHPPLSAFVSTHTNISKTFQGTKPETFMNQKPWTDMFNNRMEALRVYANTLGYKGDVKDLVGNPEELENLKEEITGGGYLDANLAEYGDDSQNVAKALQSYVDYLKRINEEYEQMFGKPLVQVLNAVGGGSLSGLPTGITIK